MQKMRARVKSGQSGNFGRFNSAENAKKWSNFECPAVKSGKSGCQFGEF
jgi:hypothetical protein